MATTLAAKSGSRGSTCTSSKFWLVMVVMMLTFMCSGVIYGWTGMLLILRKEGVYQQYSEGEQEEKFDLIMTIASFFTAGSGLFIGVFLDAFGPRITALCSGVVTIAGCFVFGFQWNLTVGYAMFAVGGMGILISSFRAAYLFPAHQSLVIGSISCLFDSSTVIFVVFDVLYENFGLTLKQLCMGYAAICLLLQIALFALWSMNPTFDRLQAKAEEPDEAKSLLDVATRPAAVVDSDDDDDDDTTLVAELPFKQQLRTVEFVFIYIFCCVMMFRSNLFLGTAGNFLISLGDDKDDDRYAKLLASIIPLGFIFVPVISYFLDRTGFAVSAYMVVVIGLAYGGLSIVPILQVQLGTAFMFTFYRAALFFLCGSVQREDLWACVRWSRHWDPVHDDRCTHRASVPSHYPNCGHVPQQLPATARVPDTVLCPYVHRRRMRPMLLQGSWMARRAAGLRLGR